jgi:transposase-like protein
MSFTPTRCANLNCTSQSFIKKGFHSVRRINQKFRKYQCKTCGRYFSLRSFKPDYRHKKMDLNPIFARLLSEGNSLRGIGRILGLTYYNTYKKFLWFKTLVIEHQKSLHFTAKEIQFDEMESIHHTKCKPLNLVVVLNEKYQLMSAKVAEMPAKGRLAEFSRKKYGIRKNEREQKIREAFSEVCNRLTTSPDLIKSDAHPTYRKLVSSFFPETRYEQFSRKKNKDKLRERMHEKLNKRKYDPIFVVNHKCAILRDRIKRLVRRNWCTTKKVENLQLHLDLFICLQSGLRV